MTALQAFIDFSITVIGPVLLLIAIGYGFYRQDLLDDSFVEKASRLIFNYALPALLFVNISASDISALTDPKTIAIGISGTLIVFLFYIVWVCFYVPRREDRGVIVQGAFRSNMGIIGLAYCANAYGTEGLAYASIYLGALTILYNVLSVAVLNIFQGSTFSKTRIVKGILSNPIILSIVAGVLVSYFSLPTPTFITNSLGYFAQLTLPLALLCTGASLRFKSLGKEWQWVLLACIGKCFLYPIVLLSLALTFDISGLSLGVVFLMAMSPTAAASYVMVRKIGGNHQLAAQIIAMSTIASLPITIVGYYIMLRFTDIV
ncbi:AEC family transporter [Glaciecola siphonariae]|uniref:AEC family transporter n=1 Tax=Glaciecola siphonariae TaxID=521012 RepID=A0ABV9M0H3_9ALTE